MVHKKLDYFILTLTPPLLKDFILLISNPNEGVEKGYRGVR
jgi:hypothetical protein